MQAVLRAAGTHGASLVLVRGSAGAPPFSEQGTLFPSKVIRQQVPNSGKTARRKLSSSATATDHGWKILKAAQAELWGWARPGRMLPCAFGACDWPRDLERTQLHPPHLELVKMKTGLNGEVCFFSFLMTALSVCEKCPWST